MSVPSSLSSNQLGLAVGPNEQVWYTPPYTAYALPERLIDGAPLTIPVLNCFLDIHGVPCVPTNWTFLVSSSPFFVYPVYMMWPIRSDIPVSILMVLKVKYKKGMIGNTFARAFQRRGSSFRPQFEKLSVASPKYLSIFLAFSMGSFIDALLIVMNWVMKFLERSLPLSSLQRCLSIIFSPWSGKTISEAIIRI